MTGTESLYDVLSVPEAATGDEIKRAYYVLIRKQRAEKDPAAFKRLTEAFETLNDARRRGEYDQMRRFGDQVTELTDEAVEVMEDDPERAVRLLKKAAVLAPDLAGTRWQLGRALIAHKNFAGAESEFRRLLEKTPDDAAALHYQIGGCLYRQERLDEAERELSQAVELDGGQYNALLLLSSLYNERDEPQRAVAVLEQAIRINGTEDFGDLDVLLRLLTLHVAREDGPAAEAVARRLHAVVPEDEDAANYAMARTFDLGVDFFRAGNYGGAFEIVRRVGHPRMTDPELQKAVSGAQSHFGACADAARVLGDDDCPRSLKAYLVWKYLDPDDEMEEEVADAALSQLRQEAVSAPQQYATLVRRMRAAYPRMAALEADLLSHVEHVAATAVAGQPPQVAVAAGQPPSPNAGGQAQGGGGNVFGGCLLAFVCAVVGQALLPIPFVGFVIGFAIGCWISSMVGLFK